MLGIAICTYNRADAFVELIESMRKFTASEYSIVVCDDGSSDGTVKRCDVLDLPVITGANKGVAWNKNRGLYWMMKRTTASHILLIEDDMLAVEQSWDRHWIEAIDTWGHANWADAEYMRPRGDRVISGDGTIADPFLSKVFTGCGMAFSRTALEAVGYFDPRFKGYGFEHLDMTRRCRRAGHGVITREVGEGKMDGYYVSISGGLKMKTMATQSDKASVEANRELYEQVMRESVYRDPWTDDIEKASLLTEIEVGAQHAK